MIVHFFDEQTRPDQQQRIDDLLKTNRRLSDDLVAMRAAKDLWHDRWCIAMGAFMFLVAVDLAAIVYLLWSSNA